MSTLCEEMYVYSIGREIANGVFDHTLPNVSQFEWTKRTEGRSIKIYHINDIVYEYDVKNQSMICYKDKMYDRMVVPNHLFDIMINRRSRQLLTYDFLPLNTYFNVATLFRYYEHLILPDSSTCVVIYEKYNNEKYDDSMSIKIVANLSTTEPIIRQFVQTKFKHIALPI
jgi:hypothetical protein